MEWLCNIWPVASSDWAAWVQAGGTIGALWVAIRIASRQSREARTHDEQRAQRETARAVLLCKFAAVQLGSCIAAHARLLATEQGHLLVVERHKLNDIVHLAQSIDVSKIQTDAAYAFVRMRSIAATAQAHCVELQRISGSINWQHWSKTFEALIEDLRVRVKEFDGGIGKEASHVSLH